jgi:uncharacterized RDD family membrane protein YckC
MSTPNPYAPPRAELDARPADGPPAVLATRLSRLGAALLDGLLYMGIFVVIMIGVMVAGMATREAATATGGGATAADRMGNTVGLVMTFVTVLAFVALYVFQAYRVSTTGQTLGKKWLGIRIVKLDGTPVDFVSGVLMRSIVPWLFGLICGIFSLADPLYIFGEERRCIHDHIARTKVVTA